MTGISSVERQLTGRLDTHGHADEAAAGSDAFADALSSAGKRTRSEADGDTAGASDAKRARTSGSKADALRDMGANASRSIRTNGGAKGAALQNLARQTPDLAPQERLTQLQPADFIQKRDAPTAGDHSPSIASVNRTQSPDFTITGRGASARTGSLAVGEEHVPTLQFHTPDFDQDGVHDREKDAAAHTMLTTAREMHGAGETAQHPDGASLRDAAFHAYSPYDSKGEPTMNGVTLPRVQVYSPHGTATQPLQQGSNGVSPMIGQGIINLSYAATATTPGTLPEHLDGLRMKTKKS
ncbi:hypothetical protein [Tanticharoenia sakaeratensis]|uniref:Uncharacterized protein n=1 Tax=Tanticharoenia sakaeratensis NBRC 103193 TaxID=1231623 RepID=A0A0D6MLW0_9PROT|nr:hypothetical protein [Tanticharoenia sakaeratensis]GAN54674.1 hypothetical protein Tasa_028_041 [Tanticharoenia sakaeratensis NBRC 103193]GBQ16780.1 hypothetical protein AA103193_0104 [Tanticharoenia sakaeratensis NBRC 103193]